MASWNAVVGRNGLVAYALRRASPVALMHRRHLMQDGRRLVLGIESSCDDSCAALVAAPAHYAVDASARATILSNVVIRQDHASTRGIHPLSAAHLHAQNVPLAIRRCLDEAAASAGAHADPAVPEPLPPPVLLPAQIDAIAVTQGPGMAGCLSVGLCNAKLLAQLWDKPLIYVHHMAAHALTPFLTRSDPQPFESPASSSSSSSSASTPTPTNPNPALAFPFLCLLLSGGHTLLVLVRSPRRFAILANTTDDSVGDALDKAAKHLGVETDWMHASPGAALEAFSHPARRASRHDEAKGGSHPAAPDEPPSRRLELAEKPLPMACRNEASFSFSGLKTALLLRIEQLRALPRDDNDDAGATKVDASGGPGGERPAGHTELSEAERRALAYGFQRAAFGQVVDKVRMALSRPVQRLQDDAAAGSTSPPRPSPVGVGANDDGPRTSAMAARDRRIELGEGVRWDQIRHLVVSGGVASNSLLRQSLRDALHRFGRDDVVLEFPAPWLCVDNAAMIAHAAHLDWRTTTDASPSPRSRWSLEDLRS